MLKDKNRQIEKLNEEKRNQEKIKLTQDKELDGLQKEFAYEKKVIFDPFSLLLIEFSLETYKKKPDN